MDLANELLYRPHVEAGRLVVLFPEIPVQKRQVYLYHPYLPMTPMKVKKVFDLLTDILKRRFAV